MTNLDIIVATSGRFLYLKVEMHLDLSYVEYFVHYEADRLFEMDFEEQLDELLAALPLFRQPLWLSATLCRPLTDFAKAGSTNPELVKFVAEAESKFYDLLQMAFYSRKRPRKMLLFYTNFKK